MDGIQAQEQALAMQGFPRYYTIVSEPERVTHVLLFGILSELIAIKEVLRAHECSGQKLAANFTSH